MRPREVFLFSIQQVPYAQVARQSMPVICRAAAMCELYFYYIVMRFSSHPICTFVTCYLFFSFLDWFCGIPRSPLTFIVVRRARMGNGGREMNLKRNNQISWLTRWPEPRVSRLATNTNDKSTARATHILVNHPCAAHPPRRRGLLKISIENHTFRQNGRRKTKYVSRARLVDVRKRVSARVECIPRKCRQNY